MTSNSLATWFGLNYGNSIYFGYYESLSDARNDFNNRFTNWLAIKQSNINAYYNTLFDKIDKYFDEMTFTKEGSTTLEKHKGRKESTNTNVKDSFEESTKKSQNTDITENRHEDYTETTNHGKTIKDAQDYKDTHSRVYFGSTTMHDNEETTHTGATGSATTNVLKEGGTTSVRHTSANEDEENDGDYTTTNGLAENNYIETIRHANVNYKERIGNALQNYTTIEDISASVFDKDVMDYNNYTETTNNSWHSVQVAFDLLGKLHNKTYVEELLKEFFNYICFCVE